VVGPQAQNFLIGQQTEPTSRSYRGISVPIASRPFASHRQFDNNGVISHRNFSSLSADKVQNKDGEEQITSSMPQRAAPSALEQANLPELTPGHAMFVLQNYAANGLRLIRQSDFVKLCEYARPGKKKDAKVIAAALKEFKANNRFVLQTVGSRAAVNGMLHSMIPTWKVQDGKPRVQAAVFVGEQIIDEKSGMYFACETVMVDKVLEELDKGIHEMKTNGLTFKLHNVGEDAEGEEEEPSAEQKLLKDALQVTEGMVKMLIKRKCRPEMDMKKRAKRVYLKRLQVGGGPYDSTMELATRISLLIGGSAFAKDNIIAPWEEAWWTKRKVLDPSILEWIEKVSEEEKLNAQRAAEAAEAAEASEEGDAENDESKEEDEDASEGQEEGTDESKEEKKD